MSKDVLIENYRTQLVEFEPNLEQLAKLGRQNHASAEYLPYLLGDGNDHRRNKKSCGRFVQMSW